MKPTAREYAQAEDKGAQCARAGKSQSENPWKNDHTERGMILCEQFDDGYWQAKNAKAVA